MTKKGACLAMIRMFRNVVRGFSLVHDPEGSRYKRGACLVMTAFSVIASPFATAQGRLRRGNLGGVNQLQSVVSPQNGARGIA